MKGAWRVESSEGASIAHLGYMLAEELLSPLSIYTETKADRLEKPVITDRKKTATKLFLSKERTARLIQTGALDLRKPKWTREPLTKEAISKLSNIQYEEDELKATKAPEQGCPASEGIFRKIGVTRHDIKQAFNELSYRKQAHTVLRSVICATRFKYAEASKLVPTNCRKCGRRDSFPHLLDCTRLEIPTLTQDPD